MKILTHEFYDIAAAETFVAAHKCYVLPLQRVDGVGVWGTGGPVFPCYSPECGLTGTFLVYEILQ